MRSSTDRAVSGRGIPAYVCINVSDLRDRKYDHHEYDKSSRKLAETLVAMLGNFAHRVDTGNSHSPIVTGVLTQNHEI